MKNLFFLISLLSLVALEQGCQREDSDIQREVIRGNDDLREDDSSKQHLPTDDKALLKDEEVEIDD